MIPLLDVVAKIGEVAFSQIGAIVSNVGVTAFTLIDNVVVIAHCPAVGVKV